MEGPKIRQEEVEHIGERLKELIEQDEHTLLLTVAQMALKEIKEGRIDSAISRLRIDMDKFIVTNPALYEYVNSLPERKRVLIIGGSAGSDMLREAGRKLNELPIGKAVVSEEKNKLADAPDISKMVGKEIPREQKQKPPRHTKKKGQKY